MVSISLLFVPDVFRVSAVLFWFQGKRYGHNMTCMKFRV